MIKNHYLFSMYSFFFSMFSKSHLFWCIYCTKLEPISKIGNVTARAERVVALTKIVRSEKAPRTGEYASNPERKNTPCISDLAGGKFLFKKERIFFCGGGSFFLLWCGFFPAAGGVWGGMRAGIRFLIFSVAGLCISIS